MVTQYAGHWLSGLKSVTFFCLSLLDDAFFDQRAIAQQLTMRKLGHLIFLHLRRFLLSQKYHSRFWV